MCVLVETPINAPNDDRHTADALVNISKLKPGMSLLQVDVQSVFEGFRAPPLMIDITDALVSTTRSEVYYKFSRG